MASISLMLFGYQFNTGDQSEYLPQVYRMFNPSLYQHDFFMQMNAQTFSIRFYWTYLVYFLSLITGVGNACFILYFFSIQFTFLAWMKIGKELTGLQTTSYLIPPMLMCFNSFTLGGNSLLEPIFTSSTLALLGGSWGIYFSIKKQLPVAMISLGVASLFQVLIGLQLFLLLMIYPFYQVYKKQLHFYMLLRYVGIYVLVASPMIIPIVYRQLILPVELETTHEFYTLLFYNRAPWHYIPSYFPLSDYVKTGILLLLTLASILLMKSAFTSRLMPLIFGSILGCVVYTICIETEFAMVIGKLQWYKTSIWITVSCVVLISGFLAGKIRFGHLSTPWINMISIVLVFMVMIFLFLPNTFFEDKKGQRYQIGSYHLSNQQLLHAWIKTNTPAQSSFLIPPNDESFTCETQRATPMNYKAIIHEPFYMLAWRDRMSKWYDIDFNALGKRQVLPIAMSNYSAAVMNHGVDVDYIEVNQSDMMPDTSQFSCLVSYGNQSLWRSKHHSDRP